MADPLTVSYFIAKTARALGTVLNIIDPDGDGEDHEDERRDPVPPWWMG